MTPHEMTKRLTELAEHLPAITEHKDWDGDYAALLTAMGKATDALRVVAAVTGQAEFKRPSESEASDR